MTQLLNYLNTVEEHAAPEEGMGATLCLWTDRHAYTITVVGPHGRWFKMQRDNAIRTDKNGMSDCQSYRYERNPDGEVLTIRMTKRGWRLGGMRGSKVLVGVRAEHYDYSF